MKQRVLFLALSLLMALPLMLTNTAQARNLEPGRIWASGLLGPAIKLGSKLGASGGYVLLGAQGEYVFSKELSAVGDISFGLAGTIPVRLRGGARYRFADLDLPVSPYVQGQLSFGRLYDVLGADLNYFGIRVAGGADYFLTAEMAVGGQLGLDAGTTISNRNAFYGMVEILATASYAF